MANVALRNQLPSLLSVRNTKTLVVSFEEIFDALASSEQGSRLNVVAAINALFPSPDAFSGDGAIDAIIRESKERLHGADEDLHVAVLAQLKSPEVDPKKELAEAHADVVQALSRLRCSRQTAEQTRDVTEGIRSDGQLLRVAYDKLDMGLKTLHGIKALIAGLNNVWSLLTEGDFRGVRQALAGLRETLAVFEPYRRDTMAIHYFNDYGIMRSKVADRILEEFTDALKHWASMEPDPTRLSPASGIVDDCLDAGIRTTLVTRICDQLLYDYDRVFREDPDLAWLDKIDQRFLWFRQNVSRYQESWSEIFPASWKIPFAFAERFCESSRSHLSACMMERKLDLSARLIIAAVRKALMFEKYLHAAFVEESVPYVCEGRSLEDDAQLGPVPAESRFKGGISECFVPFFYVYVDRQDLELQSRIRSYLDTLKMQGFPSFSAVKASSAILPSAVDLFICFRRSMAQCAQVTQGQSLFALSSIFQRYLREYATRVLLDLLPKNPRRVCATNTSSMTALSTSSSPLAAGTLLASGIQASFLESTRIPANLVQNLQNLVKERTGTAGSIFGGGGGVTNVTSSGVCNEVPDLKGSDDDVDIPFDMVRVCMILCTAEYCLETCMQLEGKMKEMLDTPYKETVDFSGEVESFNAVICRSMDGVVDQLVARSEEVLLTTPFRKSGEKHGVKPGKDDQPVSGSGASGDANADVKIDEKKETISDESRVDEALALVIGDDIARARDCLSQSRKFFINIVSKFVADFVPKFTRELFKGGCSGAAMARELAAVKAFLIRLPNWRAGGTSKGWRTRGDDGVPPPASYIHAVHSGLRRAEIIVTMARRPLGEEIRRFVRDYINLSGETCDAADFQKILELKGLNMWRRNRAMNNFKLLAAGAHKCRTSPVKTLEEIAGGILPQATVSPTPSLAEPRRSPSLSSECGGKETTSRDDGDTVSAELGKSKKSASSDDYVTSSVALGKKTVEAFQKDLDALFPLSDDSTSTGPVAAARRLARIIQESF